MTFAAQTFLGALVARGVALSITAPGTAQASPALQSAYSHLDPRRPRCTASVQACVSLTLVEYWEERASIMQFGPVRTKLLPAAM